LQNPLQNVKKGQVFIFSFKKSDGKLRKSPPFTRWIFYGGL